MEKVVLSNGAEFELIPNAVSTAGNVLTVLFKPGDKTAEQMISLWENNETITVKVGDADIQRYANYTLFKSVTITPNYLISTEYVCPECGAAVDHMATTCPECNAAFDAPKMVEVRDTVCTVKVAIPDINDRMNDVEDSIGDIISTLLG